MNMTDLFNAGEVVPYQPYNPPYSLLHDAPR